MKKTVIKEEGRRRGRMVLEERADSTDSNPMLNSTEKIRLKRFYRDEQTRDQQDL